MRNKKHRMVVIKSISLKREITLTKEIFSAAELEFLSHYNKNKFDPNESKKEVIVDEWDPNIDPKHPPEGEPLNKRSVLDSVESPDEVFRSLYKTIARNTHPDRVRSLTEKEQKEKQDMFLRCREAMKEDDIVTILEIADLLELDLPELSKKHIDLILLKNKKMQEELDFIKKTLLWVWYNSDDDQQKERLLNELLSRSDLSA